MRTIREIGEIRGSKLLLRADLDVAITDNKIMEPFRVQKQKETIDYLVSSGCKVVMMGHISDIDSFGLIRSQLETIWGRKVEYIKDLDSISDFLEHSQLSVGLLENIRKFDGEKENSEVLAGRLATGFDYYVNNAFAVSHRNQASIVAITKFLPSFAGFQLIKEVETLTKVLNAPKEGKVIIIGGAKAETKVPVIKKFINKTDKIIMGGVVANDYLKAKGEEVGDSKVDANPEQLFDGIDLNSDILMPPMDFVIFENKILDIGAQTIEKISQTVKVAKMVVWNGPVGMFEDERFSGGTKAVAEAIVGVPESIIGGGDTVSAIDKFGFMDKYSFVSTGGGAMLEFLAGNVLPGIFALNK